MFRLVWMMEKTGSRKYCWTVPLRVSIWSPNVKARAKVAHCIDFVKLHYFERKAQTVQKLSFDDSLMHDKNFTCKTTQKHSWIKLQCPRCSRHRWRSIFERWNRIPSRHFVHENVVCLLIRGPFYSYNSRDYRFGVQKRKGAKNISREIYTGSQHTLPCPPPCVHTVLHNEPCKDIFESVCQYCILGRAG